MKRSVLLSSFLVAAVLTPMLLQTNYCDLEKYQKLATLELYVPDINGQNVISDFDPDGILYKVEVPLDPPDTAVLVVQAQDATATVEVTYDSLPISLGPNGVAPLTLGTNHSEIKVAVMGDNKAWTYTVSIDRVDYCPCDDGNACTYDVCIPADQVCVYPVVPDGTFCEGIRGGCYGGVCNFVPVTVAVGAKEVVFDWTTDRCEDPGFADSPADAVRAPDGQIVLFAIHGHDRAYLHRGPDFDALELDCSSPVHESAALSTPESYENFEWLWSPYREGSDWHVLMHNEFHDAEAGPPCETGNPAAGNPCWYNSITYAVSTDNAHRFESPGAPAHVVAPPPNIWVPPPPGWPPDSEGSYLEGYLQPSSIVRGPEGYYYFTVLAKPSYLTSVAGICVLRTKTLDDPASWRAWSGSGFSLPLLSPYATGSPGQVCRFVAPSAGLITTDSLTYNTYVGRYMLLSSTIMDLAQGTCGIVLSLSTDLVHWSHAQLLAPSDLVYGGCTTDPQTPGLLEPVAIAYPSIIDHADSTTNFERAGRTPYLYYTRFNGGGDRDLVRVPLKFTLGGVLCEGVDCDDQNECTEDVCNGADGSCEYAPIECVPDFNDCTVDTCTPALGCSANVADATPCAGGTCQAGACELTGSVLPCTEQGIRNAIAAGGGPYTFDCATPTTIVTAAEIVIDNNVILDGQGKLTVDANAGHRVLSVAADATAELIGFTVTGGSTVESGGGILNAGTLALTNSTISGNSAQSSGGVRNLETGTLTIANSVISQNTAAQFGGGMHNFGQAEIVDTTISNNTAESGSGGVSNRSGATLTLTSSLVQGNTSALGAGGISNAGTMTLTTTTILGNEAGTSGGGVSNNDGVLTLANATVSGNASGTDGGGVWNDDASVVTLTNSTISENTAINQGGGIFSGGTLTLSNSTVFGNSAVYGAGIYNDYTAVSLTLTNTTVSLNSATNSGGGGIANLSVMTLVSTTLSDNLATEIGSAISNVGAALVRNTIIDGDCWFATPLDSLGGNIESEGNTCGFGHPTDKTVPAPLLLLGPLQDNGGPTMTHALLPGSEAIDWIPEAMCIGADGQPLTTDQRGQPRPAGPGCDVGSFEVQP